MKWLIVGVWAACAAYIHLRGKVRLRLGRQLTDHSSVLAPLNVLLCAASPLPVKPFLPRDRFPALDSLRDNWKTISDEALALADSGDRKSVVQGKSVSVRVGVGGCRIIKQKNENRINRCTC